MSVDFEGTLYFDQVARKIHDGLADGLEAAIGHILDVSKTRVPVLEGGLRDTGDTDTDRDQLEAAAFYGGAYPEGVKAVVQHEALNYNHPNGGEPKFLESAFASEADQIAPIIASHVKSRT